jgi:hypothetical protein
MLASSLAGRFGVRVVKISANVTARSKSRVVRPAGAVVHVLGVVGVVGEVCAARGITPTNAKSSVAAVKVGSIRFQSFIIISPLNALNSTLLLPKKQQPESMRHGT